ncbi:DUF6179 domain-containing protein [Enterococcus sp. LJL51]|uniref:DUF6179 domain-containing protein n=1 Tax=Enterococcus sp. LJL51 TaxID=3416656 RepID=UPI003CEE9AC4
MNQLMNNFHFSESDVLLLLKQLLLEKVSGTSVVPVDEAENVLLSLLYTMNHAEAGNQQLSAAAAFEQGKLQLKKHLARAEGLYQEVLQTRTPLPVESYQNLLQDFSEFFVSYDMEYGAHQTGALWIDYQLAFPLDDQQLKGVDFVEAFLAALLWENNFCKAFSASCLLELFQAYERQVKVDYQTDINNIYERVFFQAFGKQLIGRDFTNTLLFSNAEIDELLEKAHQINHHHQEKFFKEMLCRLELSDSVYYRKSLGNFLYKLDNNTAKDQKSLFILKKEPASLFIANEGLLMESFTEVVTQAAVLKSTDKVAFLIESFVSIYDYLDFFELELLSEKEYELLFKSLQLEMIAVLIKFSAQRDEWEEIVKLEDFMRLEFKEPWKIDFYNYLNSLKADTRKRVDDHLKQLELPSLDFQ